MSLSDSFSDLLSVVILPVLYSHSFIIWGTESRPTGGHVSKKHSLIKPKSNKQSDHLLMTPINMWPTSTNFNPTYFSPGSTLKGKAQQIRLLLKFILLRYFNEQIQ
jgi:hypothetical protein